MAEMKRCVQCGLLKDADEFRKYTYSRQNGTDGRYRICKSCENINTKYKRAKDLIASMPECSTRDPIYKKWSHALELIPKVETLYKMLEDKGLHVGVGRTSDEFKDPDVDSLMQFYAQPTKATATRLSCTDNLPDDLKQWLTVDPRRWIDASLTPEYLQETIYESLKAKYRPQIDFNTTTCLPVFDDTYKDALNEILKRFDDYEDSYAAQNIEEVGVDDITALAQGYQDDE